ncbi:MAG: hypothetical protein JO002_13045, partial [Burkholderiaceae bacterium]|nr:hypothetical protein [Burkholderiaceae bacterium]
MAEEKTLGDILAKIKSEHGETVWNEPPELWNPNIAALLSYPLTPLFGAYFHRRNWLALGEPVRARRSGIFFFISLVVLAVGGIASMAEDDGVYF